jgi:hypothetical protein
MRSCCHRQRNAETDRAAGVSSACARLHDRVDLRDARLRAFRLLPAPLLPAAGQLPGRGLRAAEAPAVHAEVRAGQCANMLCPWPMPQLCSQPGQDAGMPSCANCCMLWHMWCCAGRG